MSDHVKRWQPGTDVVAYDGRHGKVIGEDGLYSFPEVRWADRTTSLIDGELLTRAPEDFLNRAIANTETM